MTAPERIWAMPFDLTSAEVTPESVRWCRDDEWYVTHEPENGVQEWVRADLYATLAARVRSLEEADDFAALIADARAAAERAMTKFPQPNYVISKIAEESGEVVKAAIHCAEGRETAENLRGEMVQTIAMLYRLWVEGDGVHGLPAVRAALSTSKEGSE